MLNLTFLSTIYRYDDEQLLVYFDLLILAQDPKSPLRLPILVYSPKVKLDIIKINAEYRTTEASRLLQLMHVHRLLENGIQSYLRISDPDDPRIEEGKRLVKALYTEIEKAATDNENIHELAEQQNLMQVFSADDMKAITHMDWKAAHHYEYKMQPSGAVLKKFIKEHAHDEEYASALEMAWGKILGSAERNKSDFPLRYLTNAEVRSIKRSRSLGWHESSACK